MPEEKIVNDSQSIVERIVHDSQDLTDQDYAFAIQEIHDALEKAPEFAMRDLLNGEETEAGMQARLDKVAELQDRMAARFHGPEAIRVITGRQKLGGKYGAIWWYEKFLVEFRLRKPPGVADNYWKAIADAYAFVMTTRVRSKGLMGDRVLADQLAFEKWHFERRHGNAEPPQDGQWVPDAIEKNLRRGPIPVSGNGATPRRREWDPTSKFKPAAPECVFDGNETVEPIWTPTENTKGLPTKINRSNSFETNKAIPEALRKSREEWEKDERPGKDK